MIIRSPRRGLAFRPSLRRRGEFLQFYKCHSAKIVLDFVVEPWTNLIQLSHSQCRRTQNEHGKSGNCREADLLKIRNRVRNCPNR
jgi:hypothetical protein